MTIIALELFFACIALGFTLFATKMNKFGKVIPLTSTVFGLIAALNMALGAFMLSETQKGNSTTPDISNSAGLIFLIGGLALLIASISFSNKKNPR